VQRRSFYNLVVLVLDGELGLAPKTNGGLGVILRRQPEAVHLCIVVCKIGLRDPHGWVPVRLSFDPHNRKVFRVYPDSSAVQELIVALWLQAENVLGTCWSHFITHERKVVIVARKRAVPAIITGGSFLLGVQ